MRRYFWVGLLGCGAVGLGIRLGSVFGRPNRPPGGDPFAYWAGARLLVEGHGFINPFGYYWGHHLVSQSAAYPPLFIVVLTGPMLFGFKSFFAARIWCCILGALGVVAIGLAGREVAGRRVGLIAAFFTAVYPNIWMSDELSAAEALDPLLIGAVLVFAYRFWKQPGYGRAIGLGVVMAITILGRDELSLLPLLILVPLALMARTLPWRRRLAVGAVGLLSVGVVVAPWVGYNMSRFEKPTYISNGLGPTLATADCTQTWSGAAEGYWSFGCGLQASAATHVHGDQSVANVAEQNYAVAFVKHHLGRLFPVTMAKIGRGFAFFHPQEQIYYDTFIETRPYGWAETGLIMYYVLLGLSLAGTVVLRRRRIPSFPLWAVGLNVLIAMVITFGNTRYRTPFEISLVILAAVALEAAVRAAGRLLGRPAHRRGRRSPVAPVPEARQPVPT